MKTRNTIRYFAATAAAVILLAACGKDGGTADDYTPVKAQVTAGIDEMTTRASGTTWAAGDEIGVSAVTGTQQYDNIRYRTGDGTGNFLVVNDVAGVDNSIYYQNPDEVTFTAYYPYSGANGVQPGTAGVINYTMTADDFKPGGLPQVDFLWATAKGSSAAPDVKFAFKHAMTRLVLAFEEGTGVVQLADIAYTLEGLRAGGTFNTLTGVAQQEGTVGITISGDVPASSEMKAELIVFPGQQGDLTLTLTMAGIPYKATFPMAVEEGTTNSIPLEAGASYTYNVKVNKETLTIERAAIAPWDGQKPQDVLVTF